MTARAERLSIDEIPVLDLWINQYYADSNKYILLCGHVLVV